MAGTDKIFKGKLNLAINESLTEAYLELEKANDGDFWDANGLFAYLRKQQVNSGIDKDAILEKFAEFHKSSEKTTRFLIAQGEAAESASDEKWLILDIPIPDSLRERAESVFSRAPQPEIFIKQVQKVELTPQEMKQLGRDPKDPAQKYKEEVLREKVRINPKIEIKGYASAHTIVAKVEPKFPGKPGKDITGKVIPPTTEPGNPYYFGDGLSRDGNMVMTEQSGFLRIGKNWIDLLPFAAHEWSVEGSEDKINCYFSFSPGDKASPPVSVGEILAAAEEKGFPQDRLISSTEIEKLIGQSLASGNPFAKVPITPTEDGSYTIRPTLDRLKVFLNINKSTGDGKAVTADTIENELKRLAFKGLKIPDVMKKVQSFLRSPLLALENFLLIQGQAPTRGKDRELEFFVDFMTSEEWERVRERAENQPELLEGAPGLIQFPVNEVEKAAEVHKDQELAKLSQPQGSEGKPGVDIFGETIPAYPGNDPVINFFGNIKRTGDTLVANKEGILEICKSEDGLFLRLRDHKSGKISITRSDDNMEAFLSLEEGIGTGQPLTLERIQHQIELEHITHGLREDLLPKALVRAKNVGLVKNLLIAKGNPPGTDLSRRVQIKYPQGTKPPKPGPGGVQRIGVKKGQTVALYDPPVAVDGKDIMGNLIPADMMEMNELIIGDHLQVKPRPESTIQEIIALSSGELIFDGENMRIRSKLVIPGDVGAKSGNLKFPGEVLVEGGVEKGYYVFAGGFLRVNGPVQEALLSSEDGVALGSAFRGNGKGVIRAKKDIRAPYVEKVTLLAVGNAIIKKAALNCKFKCAGKVVQSDPQGTLSGGHIKAKHGLQVMNLGNAKRTPTLVSFGQDYLIEDHVESGERELDKIREAILKLDQLMKTLTKPEDKPRLYAARKKKVLALKALEKKGIALINLRDKFEAHFPSELIVRGVLYPGVTIESHGRVFEILEKRQSVKITFDPETGKISETPLPRTSDPKPSQG